jgi:hypothetical protein
VAAITAMALLAAGASAKEPNPGYTQFAGCPSPEENPAVAICIRSEVNGGHLQTGKKNVPIENPLTISGGLNNEFEGFSFNSKGGLSKSQTESPRRSSRLDRVDLASRILRQRCVDPLCRNGIGRHAR